MLVGRVVDARQAGSLRRGQPLPGHGIQPARPAIMGEIAMKPVAGRISTTSTLLSTRTGKRGARQQRDGTDFGADQHPVSATAATRPISTNHGPGRQRPASTRSSRCSAGTVIEDRLDPLQETRVRTWCTTRAGPADGCRLERGALQELGESPGNMANSFETVSVAGGRLRVPGAVYCADADCSTHPHWHSGLGRAGKRCAPRRVHDQRDHRRGTSCTGHCTLDRTYRSAPGS